MSLMLPYVARVSTVTETVIHAESLKEAEIQARSEAVRRGGTLIAVGTVEALNTPGTSYTPGDKKAKRIQVRPCNCPQCTPPEAA